MTEDEAKTKWCPFVRSGDGDRTNGVNRIVAEPNGEWNACIGSKCMAWQETNMRNAGYCGLILVRQL